MGKHIILKGKLDDLNAATYHSILADEVTSHNKEHLAIGAWFQVCCFEGKKSKILFFSLPFPRQY